MRIDFHSHILPEMDDGASSTEESIRLLKILAGSGVEKVVLTPHFYRQNESISTFLERRERSYEKLCRAVSGMDFLPSLVLGAEVYFYPSLSSDPDFEKLCIEGTQYILLELPFERFYDNFYSEFIHFMNRSRAGIILAHIERYLTFGNTMNDIAELLKTQDITCQMNCTSIAEAGFFKRKQLLEMLQNGTVRLLGTDTHNTKSRPPKFKEAEKIIRQKCGDRLFDRICTDSFNILSEQTRITKNT
ncbi:MAG: CpsB/CapC family capsule biosynthesis tyrosine phosphatase [Oscillospiraceae bacterium]